MRLVVFFFFAACDTNPKIYGPTFDGGDAASDSPSDVTIAEGGDANPTDAATDAPSCSGTVAVLGGSATSLFGAGGHAWSGLAATSLTGTLLDCAGGCAVPAAIVPFGSGLLAAFADGSGVVSSSVYGASWSAPAAIAGVSVTIDGPKLAIVGASAHLVTQGADYKYYHAQYTGSAWTNTGDPVGAPQSFGPRGPAAAGSGSTLTIVQGGGDGYLYAQSWSASSWQAAVKQAGAPVQNSVPPAMTTLSSSELLAVYARNNDYVFMSLTTTSGVWAANPVQVNAVAYGNDPVALTALPAGKALLVYRGGDQHAYFSVYDGQVWSTPAAVLSPNPTIAASPSVTAGVCGADAIVAWAESGGGVTLIPFTQGAFGAAASVSGTSGAKYVAIGTVP